MDVDILLAPLDGDSPSGAELRNDVRYHAIERLLDTAAKAVRVSPDGTINASAPPTDWATIQSSGIELAGSGRDLRLLVVLVRAAFAEDGFEGLFQGLDLLDQTIDQYWDSVHPALRDRETAQDRVQPRLNAMKQLENDDNGLLGDLKYSVVLSPRGIGPITGEDLSVAMLSKFDVLSKYKGATPNELTAFGSKHEARVNRVRAATRALAAEELERAEKLVASVQAARDKITDLCTRFTEAAGLPAESGLKLAETLNVLAQIQKTLETSMSDMDDDAETEVKPEAPVVNATAPQQKHAATKANGAVPGNISSRADVEKCLESIIAFYEDTEPSSPIPHLARRMRRMVPMDFVELMEEIAPSGMKEFRSVAGVEEPKKK